MSSTLKKAGLSLVGNPVSPPDKQQERPYFAVYTEETSVDGRLCRPGTWLHDIERNRTGDGTPVDRRICDPLQVVADTQNTEDGSYGLLVRFTTRARQNRPGQQVERVIPREELAGRGDGVLRELMGAGLMIEHRHQNMLPRYLSECAPDKLIEVTSKTGWHGSGAFVLPGRIIGNGDVSYRNTGRAANPFRLQGSLESWQHEVGSYCMGNPVLIASVCCALAGPLLTKVGVHGGGLHLVGKSSSGKSLAQLVAASVWGEPAAFTATWDVTPNGMEIAAASRNDTVLILDEISRANPTKVAAMAYLIANGEGKGTMTREREARHVMTWRLLALSSGETSLSEHAKQGGQRSQAGAELRMVDVDAGNRPYRAFDDVHGMEASEFHATLTRNVNKNFGHLGPAFVEQVMQKLCEPELYSAFVAIQSKFAVNNAQAGRVAARFAVMALAGELASQWGLTGWPEGAALQACRTLFFEWLDVVGDGNTEDRKILQSVASFLEKHADSHFSNINTANSPGPIIRERAGYFDLIGEEERMLFLFSSAGLELAAPEHSLRQIISALRSADALASTDNDKSSKRRRVPGGGLQRFYIVDREKLYPTETTEKHHE